MAVDQEILDALPHRDPYLFIDKIVSIKDKTIITSKELTGQEYFFKGHYPGRPIMPGALTCEALFQTGALLLAKTTAASEGVPIVTRVNTIKFKKMIIPPVIVTMEAEMVDKISNVFYFKGKAKTGQGVCVTCEFACTTG